MLLVILTAEKKRDGKDFFFLPVGKHNSHVYSTCLSPVKTWVVTEPAGHLSASVIT